MLVTGGAGFIGSHLVDRLITESPRKIVVVDNFFLGNETNLDDARAAYPDLEVIRLDASDLAAMQDVVATHQIETVFDLAVVPLPTSLEYPHWTMLTNIGITATGRDGSARSMTLWYMANTDGEAGFDTPRPLHDALRMWAVVEDTLLVAVQRQYTDIMTQPANAFRP